MSASTCKGKAIVVLLATTVFVACGGSDTTATRAPNKDSTSVVVGSGGATVVVPSGAAGVEIPAGIFSQPVTVTVSLLETPPTVGTGPLPTPLKQYPPYYEFVTSPPGVSFGAGVRVGVCQVTDPSNKFYPPESTHPRLRLAHTVQGAIEVLAPVDVSDFLRCTAVTAEAREHHSPLSRVTRSVGSIFGRFAPVAAYAAHGGLGGKVKSFSPFAAVDPGPNVPATVAVSARGTFLLTSANDNAVDPPTIIDLKALGFVDGDRLRLETVGSFSFTATGPENGNRMIAVFSSTNELLDRSTPKRVPGALSTDAVFDDETADTCPIKIGFDIPEDFLVNNTTVTVPVGARYLFLGVLDCFCSDNVDADSNFAVRVSLP